jgi:hypothetical protein
MAVLPYAGDPPEDDQPGFFLKLTYLEWAEFKVEGNQC